MHHFDGFRPNVGIILTNSEGQVLWARRRGKDAWQFPQGGIQEPETPQQALYRELHEEIGLNKTDVDIIGWTRGWLRYRLPRHLIRSDRTPAYIGQKQRWFLLRLLVEESKIHLDSSDSPEFDGWQWVSYWYPLSQIIHFKREVYRKALKELAPIWIQLTLDR